jgi:hypothetical protein
MRIITGALNFDPAMLDAIAGCGAIRQSALRTPRRPERTGGELDLFLLALSVG